MVLYVWVNVMPFIGTNSTTRKIMGYTSLILLTYLISIYYMMHAIIYRAHILAILLMALMLSIYLAAN